MSVAVAIDRLTVDLSGNRILDGVSLDVPAGAFVTLLGPSGSGKTTTLNVLAGFAAAVSGHVLLGDRPIDAVPAHQRDIGFVFQNYALFPHLSVAKNVEFPLLARKIPARRRAELVARALELVHLPQAGPRPIRSLSGGQQQRVALARALVFSPALLLLDEPLAALDKQLREAMQIELKRIQRETGVTTVAVTHDQTEALSMSDRVAIMNGGRIEQVGTPDEVYHRPATAFVARFLGEANLLAVRDGRVEALGAPVEGDRDGTTVIRPEDLRVSPEPGEGLAGTVTEVVYQGPRLRLTVTAGPLDLLATVVPSELPATPVPGDRVHVSYRGRVLHTLCPEPGAAIAA
ncbi:ABC transporter ATP-binding protein [Streptomyces sp. NBC_01803]|uniref:ABC transporter ATP-binding protein n=1 Tax=Streptomyces sp. NBC_01803 TaxID=2975946 RepID=UPI002DDB1631|nr:ABC transporter ATP-binding protein [Streptomyces sp. NBC_01803]WSA45030.1 ABC transporter ATP-binding protein [Streptomyces sp. NBC_01803]